MQTPTFGEARVASKLSQTVSDRVRVRKGIEIGAEPVCNSRRIAAAPLTPAVRPKSNVPGFTSLLGEHMPANLELEPDDVCVLRISGELKRSEFAVVQEAVTQTIDADAKPRLLAILDKFEGWERGADWNDLDFLFSHSHKIAKIAIVVDPRWEVPALAFAGAGVRRASVKFFPPNELAEARQWLAG